jgi:hypothetical protein
MPAIPPRHETLPDEDLEPTNPVHGVPVDVQAESMRKLRALHNQIPHGTAQRDRQMQAWALSNSVSRQDMAIAIGLAKSRVDQIIRELTLLDQARNAREAYERLRRHMPEELLRQAIEQTRHSTQTTPGTRTRARAQVREAPGHERDRSPGLIFDLRGHRYGDESPTQLSTDCTGTRDRSLGGADADDRLRRRSGSSLRPRWISACTAGHSTCPGRHSPEWHSSSDGPLIGRTRKDRSHGWRPRGARTRSEP